MRVAIKSGGRPTQGVLKVGGRPPRPELWLLDLTPDPHWIQFGITNPNDSKGLMDLIPCGCHLVLLVAGRGNVIGSAVVPCIKPTGNSDTYWRMEGDMDFDASPVLDRTCTVKILTGHLRQPVTGVIPEYKSKSEALRRKGYFILYKYQEREATRPRRR